MTDASVVFRGTVVERKTLARRAEMGGRGRYAIIFRVDEYWKGSPSTQVTIYGMDDGTDCLGGADYALGKGYLVYAKEAESNDVMLDDDHFWYGWSDILPKGTKMLLPMVACMPGGEATKVRRALRQLGRGHLMR